MLFHPEVALVVADLLTERQAQEYLQVSRTTLWRLRRDGALPHFRVGGEVRYQRRDLVTWLNAQQKNATAAHAEAKRKIELDACASEQEEEWCREMHRQDWSFHDDVTNAHTHGLHSYPAKFPPPLPARLIEILTDRGQVVFDPFCGSGTTLVEALRLDRAAVGNDVNPIGVLASEAKTLALSAEDIRALVELRDSVRADGQRETGAISLFDGVTTPIDPMAAPPIPNIDHWFHPIAVRELGLALRRLQDLPHATTVVARATLSSILVAVSNQDSESRYTAKPVDLLPGEVLSRFARRLGEVASMHEAWASARGERECRVMGLDTRTLTRGDVGQVHAVVTSPPYANAFDYHLYHRHRMFWLGHDPARVRSLEIGSHLNHQREKDGVASYRDDMAACLRCIASCLDPGAPCAFVVGDSVFNGITVNNAHVIVEGARKAGFRCIAVEQRSIHPIKRSMIKPARRARIERLVLLVRAR
jgi:excisionase family DNA binding protein